MSGTDGGPPGRDGSAAAGLSPKDAAKRAAAEAAAEQVASGMVVGLGTGSTVRFLLERLARRIQSEGLQIQGVATSSDTVARGESLRIPMRSLDEVEELDIAIDGADEVDPARNLIKGGGGALTREKLVALAAKRFVVVADMDKQVERLGVGFPLPVEVLTFGWSHTARRLEALGCKPRQRLAADGAPLISDNGHYILDCDFAGIADPPALAEQLDGIAGVVEHGLFCAMTDEVIFASPGGSLVRT